MTLNEIMRTGAAEMNISVDETALSKFEQYYSCLTEKNKVMNLTAISGEEDVGRLLFLDSLSPLLNFDFSGKSVIDIGTGAGFPGLPLKIACPSINLTLLDSLQKRITFLEETVDTLGLTGVQWISARAEEYAAEHSAAKSTGFDFAVSRAVARLNILAELCLPYVRIGGYFIALKGPAAAEEIEEAKRGVKLLGGDDPVIIEYSVPGTDLCHKLVAVKKIRDTPIKYPRRYALIKKSPL